MFPWLNEFELTVGNPFPTHSGQMQFRTKKGIRKRDIRRRMQYQARTHQPGHIDWEGEDVGCSRRTAAVVAGDPDMDFLVSDCTLPV